MPEMTQEQALAQIKELKQKGQDKFIDELLSKVEFLNEVANKKDYEPTDHERLQFGKIVTIVNNMNNWF